MWPVYGLLCEQLTLLKWPACTVDHSWHHEHNSVYGSEHGGKRRTLWSNAKNNVRRQPANFSAGDVKQEEKEKENECFNDVSMQSNSCNIRTEEYVDAVSEPGVVGLGCDWFHRAGAFPELQNVTEYLSPHLSAPHIETFEARHVVQETHLFEKASRSGAVLVSNGGWLPHLGQPVWHCEVLRLLYCPWLLQSCASCPHAWFH